MELIDWPARQSPLAALQSPNLNRRHAAVTASTLAAFHRAHPERPMLTSESGGAGPLVWTLESLPPDVEVDGIVLIAPALSPTYDLTRALRHVRGKALVLSSSHDTFVLGTGTSTFGTIDGPRTSAAGLVGFTHPATADPAEYAKLDPRPYDPAWLWTYGNAGGHTDALGVRFASGYLAPILSAWARAATDHRPSLAPPFSAGFERIADDGAPSSIF
jgi:hypothetical protein